MKLFSYAIYQGKKHIIKNFMCINREIACFWKKKEIKSCSMTFCVKHKILRNRRKNQLWGTFHIYDEVRACSHKKKINLWNVNEFLTLNFKFGWIDFLFPLVMYVWMYVCYPHPKKKLDMFYCGFCGFDSVDISCSIVIWDVFLASRRNKIKKSLKNYFYSQHQLSNCIPILICKLFTS